MLSALISGGLSGAVFWSIIYPIDNIKTQIQMYSYSGVASRHPLHMLRQMFQEKGFRYVYRGLGTTVLRSFPVNAVLFPVYEASVLALSDS